MSYSHMGTPTLPSALTHFTSEFGMGSGGATSLLSLDKTVCTQSIMHINNLGKLFLSLITKDINIFESLNSIHVYATCTDALVSMLFMDERFHRLICQTSHNCSSKLLRCCMVKPHGQLVSVSSRPRSPYTPDLSTL